MEVDEDTHPSKSSTKPPTAPKQMRDNKASTPATTSTAQAPAVAEREPNPQPPVKPFYKVCYGCQSPDHLIADCYRATTSPRSSTFTIVKFLVC